MMIEFHTDGSALIALAGEIDILTVRAIDDAVAAALAAVPSELALLMREVTFIDSTGIGALVGARNACLARGVPFVLVEPSPVVARMLQLTGLEAVMATQPAQ